MEVKTMAKWSQEEKLKALAMAEASSIREAAAETGIPEGTIKRWRAENRTKEGRTEPNQRTNRTRPSKKVEEIAQEATELAKKEVAEYVAEQSKSVADQLLEMIELSIREAAETIKRGPKKEEARAQWLRSVIGAIAQGVEKHQLLTGKATQRQEVAQVDFTDKTIKAAFDSLYRADVSGDSPVN